MGAKNAQKRLKRFNSQNLRRFKCADPRRLRAVGGQRQVTHLAAGPRLALAVQVQMRAG